MLGLSIVDNASRLGLYPDPHEDVLGGDVQPAVVSEGHVRHGSIQTEPPNQLPILPLHTYIQYINTYIQYIHTLKHLHNTGGRLGVILHVIGIQDHSSYIDCIHTYIHAYTCTRTTVYTENEHLFVHIHLTCQNLIDDRNSAGTRRKYVAINVHFQSIGQPNFILRAGGYLLLCLCLCLYCTGGLVAVSL